MGSATNEALNVEMQESSDRPNDEEVEELEWSADQEILLLYSLHGYKPVGPNKHFSMLVIQDRLSNAMNKNISSKAIWKKLNCLYDLEALDEAEAEADAMVAVETEFALPEDEYGEMMAQKLKESALRVEKQDAESENSDSQGTEMLSDLKMVLDSSTLDNDADNSKEAGETPKGVGGKDKKEGAKRGPKKKDSTLLKDNTPLKKDITKEVPKKDTPPKKDVNKETKRGATKEDEKKDFGKKTIQEQKTDTKDKKEPKEDKKEVSTKGNKAIEKKVADQTKKEVEVKKTEQKKGVDAQKNQRAEVTKPRAETPKQLRTETPKRAEPKTLRSETPKPQRVDALKKESSAEKKKETVDKKTEKKSPEKTPENARGAKLRTREKKETEPEKVETPTATKRERSRDSTSKAADTQADEPAAKKIKTPVAKGRPTRNSIEPQQKTSSPLVNLSPQKRRTRML